MTLITFMMTMIMTRYSNYKASAKNTLRVRSVRLSVAYFSQDRAAIYHWSCELHVVPESISITTERIFVKFGMKVIPLEG
jgi:hypothetical protein